MEKTVIRPATIADLPSILALYRVLDEELVDLQPEFFCAAPREEELWRSRRTYPTGTPSLPP